MSEVERETGFENAKAGDRCYSPLFKSVNPDDKTNGVIRTICNQDFQVEIKPDIVTRYYTLMRFSFDGSFTEGGGQVLFWSNPLKGIPTRPKLKVIKKGYIGINICGESSSGRLAKAVTDIYNSPEKVKKVDDFCEPIPIEFMVEE